jgi:hypothetical protein
LTRTWLRPRGTTRRVFDFLKARRHFFPEVVRRVERSPYNPFIPLCGGVASLCLHAKHRGSMKQADQRLSLRAQTKGSSGGDIKSPAARHCVFLRDAALKMAPEMPQVAADLMSSAQSVARENNLPRSLLKGVLCCPACSYPAERGAQSQQSSYQQCQVCAFAPRVRRRGNRARPKTAANLPARKEARA